MSSGNENVEIVCGNARRDKIKNNDIEDNMGVAPVEDKIQEVR